MGDHLHHFVVRHELAGGTPGVRLRRDRPASHLGRSAAEMRSSNK
jgi:hypothetical protein